MIPSLFLVNYFYFNNFFIFFSNFSGFIIGGNLSIIFPFLSTKNLVKFHLIFFPPIPFSVLLNM